MEDAVEGVMMRPYDKYILLSEDHIYYRNHKHERDETRRRKSAFHENHKMLNIYSKREHQFVYIIGANICS